MMMVQGNGRRTKRPWFTDTQWQTIANAIVVVVIALSQALSVYFATRSSQVATEIKEELKINNNGFGSKLDNIEKTADITHALVNAGSVDEDKIVAVATKTLAVLTKDPDDVQAAEIAADELRKNVEKQKTLDAKAFPNEGQKK